MRALLLVSPLLVVACSSSAPPTPPAAPMSSAGDPAPPIVVVPEPIGEAPQLAAPNTGAASVTATIGGRPFVARSALMVRANEPFRACSSALTGTGGCSTDRDGFDITVSTIRIFERVVSCAEVGNGQLRRHDVELRPNERSIEINLQAKWPVAPAIAFGTEERDPRRDNVAVTFKDGWQGGALAKGTVQFSRATTTDGAMTFRLVTSNPSLPTSGSASGTIPFSVCR